MNYLILFTLLISTLIAIPCKLQEKKNYLQLYKKDNVMSPLIKALSNNSQSQLETLDIKSLVNIPLLSNHNITPLTHALYAKDLQLSKCLLEYGALIYIQHLYQAIKSVGNSVATIQLIEELHRYSPNLFHTYYKGMSLLRYAYYDDNKDIISLLVKFGIKLYPNYFAQKYLKDISPFYDKYLLKFKAVSLYELSQNSDYEAYRLMITPDTKSDKTKNLYTLFIQDNHCIFIQQYINEQANAKTLSINICKKFQKKILTTKFWKTNNHEVGGFHGTHLMFEGTKHNKYHVITDWNSDKDFNFTMIHQEFQKLLK
jgi:ankyrin repeat protein